MNVLLLTLSNITSLDMGSIYTDLLNEFISHGDCVYIVSPTDRRVHGKTHLVRDNAAIILRVAVGNIKNTNIIEKGISTILLERQYKSAIKRYFSDIHFDLILYSTPPITLCNTIKCIKKRGGAKTYLLLKDIFPQNAVDIGMMKKTGLEGILYKYFRVKEKELYAVSDYIGCMSPANVDYVLRSNPELPARKVEVCPNCINPIESITVDKQRIKAKYGIPDNCVTFIYGGNLGRPQGIDFIIECLSENVNRSDRYFIISGSGTEYHKLDRFFKINKPNNMCLINGLPKQKYDELLSGCDVGLIFLDHRFTIPNFPSRILSYMEHSMPVIAATDCSTDIGQVIVEGGFGWWCESLHPADFTELVNKCCIERDMIIEKGANGRQYLEKKYRSDIGYSIITRRVKNNESVSSR